MTIENKTEILELLVKIFSELELSPKSKNKRNYKIKDKFNKLSSEDYEWSDIEDAVFDIIEILDK